MPDKERKTTNTRRRPSAETIALVRAGSVTLEGATDLQYEHEGIRRQERRKQAELHLRRLANARVIDVAPQLLLVGLEHSTSHHCSDDNRDFSDDHLACPRCLLLRALDEASDTNAVDAKESAVRMLDEFTVSVNLHYNPLS